MGHGLVSCWSGEGGSPACEGGGLEDPLASRGSEVMGSWGILSTAGGLLSKGKDSCQ
jgi:hypothetical protein